jgi:hypothetical protein
MATSAASGFSNWTMDEDRTEFTPRGLQGSCPRLALPRWITKSW